MFFAVVVRSRLEDLDIARRMLLRQVEHLFGAVGLLQLQISHRQHQLGVRIRLLRFRALQQVDSLLRVARANVEFTGNQQIVGAIGIGANHLQQQALGIVGAAHASVGLRQPA